MKKRLALIGAIAWCFGGVIVDWHNTNAIFQLQEENKTLRKHNIEIMKAVSGLADNMVKKAIWDKEVSAKIRELDSRVYENTNQIIPVTVH